MLFFLVSNIIRKCHYDPINENDKLTLCSTKKKRVRSMIKKGKCKKNNIFNKNVFLNWYEAGGTIHKWMNRTCYAYEWLGTNTIFIVNSSSIFFLEKLLLVHFFYIYIYVYEKTRSILLMTYFNSQINSTSNRRITK